MLNRRCLLHQSSLLALSPFVPGFVSQTAAAAQVGKEQRMLVVIQLDGGNDGLNTVIPFADENYEKFRTNLRIDKQKIVKLTDSLGLHPGMKEAATLFDDERLAIVPGVGYPNPSRSHFRSMAIWHSARLNSSQHTGQGWLGRACDQQRKAGDVVPDAIYVGDRTVPAAIIGRRSQSIALNDERELRLAAGVVAPGRIDTSDDLLSFVQSTVDSSYAAAKRLAESEREAVDAFYPDYKLARRLRLVSRIVKMDGGTRVFYVSQPGYDTHSAQKFDHERLLTEFSRSLQAFLDDMKKAGLSERVLVMAFSEFGRRVKENASAGTDHGTSGPVFVAGQCVNAGLLSEYPSLGDLHDGDLKTTVDFRSIYSSLLSDWLGVDPAGPLGSSFRPLRVVR